MALLDRIIRSRILPSALLVIGIVALAALTCAGCGGTPRQQHGALNVITDIADPTYEAAVRGCDAARDFIVQREGTSYATDRDDMDAVNDVCDRIVAGFETLRGTQRGARSAIDGGLSGLAAQLVADGLGAWRELQELVPELLGGLTSGGES